MTSNTFLLPNLTILHSQPIPQQQLILVGGGRAPAPNWLQSIATKAPLWCIDHGLDCCRQSNIIPQRLIGDGDSAAPENWQWAQEHQVATQRFDPYKDLTDTQLALDLAAKENAYVLLTGALGGRCDHLLSTLFSFAHQNIKGCISDERETILFLKAQEEMSLTFGANPKAVSLFPISAEVAGVTLQGAEWPLNQALLQQSLPYAISNRVLANQLTISIKSGIIALMICWRE